MQKKSRAGSNELKEVIASIRRDEYLLDVDASEQVQTGVRNMHRNLDQALKLLSEDLYSKQTHFVLELVQNADDNTYPDGIAPRLQFDVTPRRLVVSNNEVGFSEDNVRALCRIGQSSKVNKSGYIGEKGIGFKSVFTVSDAPEIHSNGYHFRFDRTGENPLLGYVVPQWHEPTVATDPRATTIVLPAKNGVVFEDATLEDLDAKLLLFLAKVRELELRTGGVFKRYARRDGQNSTRLTRTVKLGGAVMESGEDHYVRFVYPMSMQDVADEKRKGINASELVLAFPVSKTHKAEPQHNCKTFAFLPIRSFGFNFCIQGDFLLSASREDIHTERAWNLRLRDGIAEAFAAAIEVFKKHPNLGFSYLKYLPTEAEVNDTFFKPVVSNLITLLNQMACIPGESGDWRKPEEILCAPGRFRELFSPSEALKLFGLDYPDSRLETDDATLTRLGCKPLLYAHFVNLFEKHHDWVVKRKSEWKAKLYAYIAEFNHEVFVKTGLLKVPCVPISDGTMAVPKQVSAFYPLSSKQRYGFEHELTIIDNQVLEQAMAISPKVADLFQVLRVKRDVPYDVVQSYILPRHANDSWMTSENEALIGHLRYIKERFDEYLAGAAANGLSPDDATNLLRAGLWIGTKESEEQWVFARSDSLYLSKAYKPKFCIETLLGSDIVPELLIAGEYLPANSKKSDEMQAEQEISSWRDFLICLGVAEAPRLVAVAPGDYKCSAELEALMKSPQWSVRKAVLEVIDRNWRQYSSHLLYWNKVGRSQNLCNTQFAAALRSMPAPTRRRTAVPMREAFLPTPEIKELFGEAPVYVEATLTNDEFKKACGVTYRVDAEACINRLRRMKVDGEETTLQLNKVYRYLEQHWDKSNSTIKQAFSNEQLIRVKGEHAVWASSSDVSWKKSGTFLDSLYPPLQGQYGDFFGFFVSKLGVPKEVPTEKMVAALARLNEIEDYDKRAAEALYIYRRASRDLTPKPGQSDVQEPDWLSTFWVEAVYLNQHGQLVSNDEYLFVNDQPELGALFEGEADISLLSIPYEELPRVKRLLTVTDVQFLSNSLEIEVVDTMQGVVHTALTAKVRSLFNCFARVLYSRNPERFENARDEGGFHHIRTLEVVEVPDIDLKVTLGDVSKLTKGEVATDGDRIIIKRGDALACDRLAMHIAKLLQAPEDLTDTFSRLLLADSVTAAEAFLQIKNISRLPSDDEAALTGEGGSEEPARSPDESPDDTQLGGEAATVDSDSPIRDLQETDIASTGVHRHAPSVPPPPIGESEELNSVTDAQAKKAGASTPGRSSNQGSGQPRNGSASRSVSPAPPPPPTAPLAPPSPSISAPPSEGSAGADTAAAPSAFGNGVAWTGHDSAPPHPKENTHSRRGGRSTSPGTKTGRLLSYADAPNGAESAPEEGGREQQAARDEIAQAAVKFFLETQANTWKSLQEMPHNNPGFDVKAFTHDDREEFIEVKGQSAAWTEVGVALTPTELSAAQRMRDRYWLCVVEFATDPSRRKLYLVRDPFGFTQQFRFDSGWKAMAISNSALLMKPEAGLFIYIPDEGKARIISVKKKGQFYKLHVILSDSRQLYRTYNPGSMKLSTE